jgi:hypothetical protein
MRPFCNQTSDLVTLGGPGRRILARFMRREDGTITTFALMIFILMVAVAGIAIDIMRYETQRVQLQYTLDRSVLAAASVTQPLNPVDVVENYFEISGLDNYRLTIDVEEGLNFRRVEAYAELEINTLFMHMFGVRVLTSPAEGAAEERIRNVEVSMVLDISGSMGWNSKLVNMQNAAREFVTTVLQANESDSGNLVSISIVPYNGMVNLGEPLENVFNLSDEHSESSCVRFTSEQFTRTNIELTEEIERIAHWDFDDYNQYDDFDSPYCPTDQYGAILPWEHDEDVLHTFIDNLQADGWTAIDLGMKMGVALLDPAARNGLNGLVTSGEIHADFEDRPANYGDPETIKVVVLMTDGENTNQYDVRQPYKSGFSPIFYHATDDRYSVHVASRDDSEDYWISIGQPNEFNGYWSDEPYSNGGEESVALGWPYLWASYTGRYIADRYLQVPANQSGDWDLYNRIRSNGDELYAGRTQGDNNLRAICDAANAQNILVFAIGFEAPAGGQAVMRHCASSDAHYYDVDGIEISDAFASIARTINSLRLIQ